MPEPIGGRLKHAWNAFKNRDPTEDDLFGRSNNWAQSQASARQDRPRLRLTTERSVIISILNRIAVDVARVSIQHVRVDQNGGYVETIDSGLNYCLTTEANIDQTSKAFIQDIVLSMFDEGVIAVVPVETSADPNLTGSYDIHSLRVGKITAWYPQHVRVKLYNERTGSQEERTLPKRMVAIIENPFFAVMNEPNSTLKRLIRKLAILDAIDEQSGSGKLDLIIQLPYVVKHPTKRREAEERRKSVEMQLTNSKYGIAYIDGTERITQLNRPAENNLMSQIQYLTSMLYSQLGISEDVFTGKADERTNLGYTNTTVTPIISAIVDEFRRTFLTKTARTQLQTIQYFKDVFSLVPVDSLADVADKFTRNEILSSNEVRAIIGFKPSNDPKADELRNKNLNAAKQDPSDEESLPKGENS